MSDKEKISQQSQSENLDYSSTTISNEEIESLFNTKITDIYSFMKLKNNLDTYISKKFY
jgi:hypothetical protein